VSYTRRDLIEVCAWKTPRRRSLVAFNARCAMASRTHRLLTANQQIRLPIAAPLSSPGMGAEWLQQVQTLLDAPSPAVLTTYRRDDSAVATPVWFRWHDMAFEVVIAERDVKLRHLARRPDCSLVVFETVRPFRGIEVRGEAEIIETDVTPIRIAIAGRYLGKGDGERYAAQRQKPGVLLRLATDQPRIWDLTPILPSAAQDSTGANDI
jgi:PPOX class probable F420-dependent enzyme